jgi:hypothetical protein
LAPGIDDFGLWPNGSLNLSHQGNSLSHHGYPTRIDFPGVDIDDLSIFNHQIGRAFPQSYGN